jgi:hypothetical protein
MSYNAERVDCAQIAGVAAAGNAARPSRNQQGQTSLNAEAQRFAKVRREFFFSAFLRDPLRLCVKSWQTAHESENRVPDIVKDKSMR